MNFFILIFLLLPIFVTDTAYSLAWKSYCQSSAGISVEAGDRFSLTIEPQMT